MTLWRLQSRGQIETPATDEDLIAAASLGGAVTVRRLADDKALVRAGAKVGTVQARHLRVVVEPRCMSREVFLSMVLRGGTVDLERIGVAKTDPDLLNVLAQALCRAMSQLFSRGLRREYRQRVERFEYLRGEVVLDRWWGLSSPEGGQRPPCRFRERSIDLPEHRLLRWVLRRLAREEALDRMIRRRCFATAERLQGVADVRPTMEDVRRCRRTGLFAGYAVVLDLAEILLRGLAGVDAGPDEGRGFLLDIDMLFESWLARRVRAEVPPGWMVTHGDSLVLAKGQKRTLNRQMDVSVRDEAGGVRAIIDAKNKLLDAMSVPPRDDVHQMIAYMTAARCRHGFLVGLSGEAVDSAVIERWEIEGGTGMLYGVALPGRGSYALFEQAMRDWFADCLAIARRGSLSVA